jgi:hypothetical protein
MPEPKSGVRGSRRIDSHQETLQRRANVAFACVSSSRQTTAAAATANESVMDVDEYDFVDSTEQLEAKKNDEAEYDIIDGLELGHSSTESNVFADSSFRLPIREKTPPPPVADSSSQYWSDVDYFSDTYPSTCRMQTLPGITIVRATAHTAHNPPAAATAGPSRSLHCSGIEAYPPRRGFEVRGPFDCSPPAQFAYRRGQRILPATDIYTPYPLRFDDFNDFNDTFPPSRSILRPIPVTPRRAYMEANHATIPDPIRGPSFYAAIASTPAAHTAVSAHDEPTSTATSDFPFPPLPTIPVQLPETPDAFAPAPSNSIQFAQQLPQQRPDEPYPHLRVDQTPAVTAMCDLQERHRQIIARLRQGQAQLSSRLNGGTQSRFRSAED